MSVLQASQTLTYIALCLVHLFPSHILQGPPEYLSVLHDIPSAIRTQMLQLSLLLVQVENRLIVCLIELDDLWSAEALHRAHFKVVLHPFEIGRFRDDIPVGALSDP